MKTSISVLATIALVLGLAGCSQPMTVEQAGETYLRTVCPINSAVDAMVRDIEEADFDSFIEDAGRVRDLSQNAAKVFSDESIVWPNDLQPIIDRMKNAQLEDAAVFNGISDLDSFDQFLAVDMTKSSSGKIGQEIRLKLDLSADTKESCAGFTY